MKLPPTFSIFPVKDKKPLVDWKEYTHRYHTYDERMEWDFKFGKNYQFGIVTGSISKVLVLDDDGGLKDKYIPKTLTQQTPRGGRHYFFKWTDELENKVTTKVGILEGVDVRGEGGFAVFYGFDKPYHLTPLAYPPKWLIDLLPNKENRINLTSTKNNSHIQDLLDNIKEGNRNDSFTRIAGSLRSRGYNSVDIFSILLPKAQEVGFKDLELKTICDSVERYEPKIKIDKLDSKSDSIEEFLKEQEKVEWLVPGIIAKKSIGFVAGLPETGKTWMLIDLAIEIAKGGKWLEKFNVNQGKTLFIDQERFKGETQRRFKALINGKELNDKILKNVLFVKSGSTIRLNLQHSFDSFRKELLEIKPDLIIIDSFVSFHTCEENNRKDIQMVLEKVKELRNEFGCTFLFIHHENKMAFNKEESGDPSIAQMAGSVAIPAVAELVLTVRKQDNESSMVYNTKSTLSSTIEPFLVKIEDKNENKTKIQVKAY